MKSQKITIKFVSLFILAVLAATFLTGCSGDAKVNDRCLNAYEQDSKAYGYTGENPEECE